ncbi:MAG TPA: hypothetical protein VH370_09750 [Humisphaera sp.]|nr:hypothetical protein [Humisphaera sp.]
MLLVLMSRTSLQTCSIFLAMAVVLVSSTCTPAGCVLPIKTTAAATDEMPCCAAHSHSDGGAPAGHDHSHDCCPTCQLSIDSNHSIARSAAIQHAMMAPCLILQMAYLPVAQSNQFGHRVDFDPSPPSAASTLFKLHCALLI